MKKRILKTVFGLALMAVFALSINTQEVEAQGYPGDDDVFNMYYWRATGWCIESANDCVGLDPVIIESGD